MFRRIVSLSVVWLAVCGMLLAAEPPGVWLDVPFVKQEKDGCGAASIAMVIQYWRMQQGQAPDDDLRRFPDSARPVLSPGPWRLCIRYGALLSGE